MASDLSLLFQLKAKNEASPVVKAVQGDINKLRQSATADFTQMGQLATVALGKVTTSITGVASEVPVLGTAVSSLTGEFAALAGPLGIAAAGFVATGVAIVGAADALFGLAKQTADYQGKLFDLSQQTGVNVETLSALEIAAANTGGSIEGITASLGIFQKNMEAAGDESSKQAAAFQKLHVTISDTEQTLRDTLLALAKMPEGYRQTAAALELFGRGGKNVLAIIKETNGDLDLLIDKLRDAGLVTTEQAKNADEFNDSLTNLTFQLRGLGTEIIPGVTAAVKDLSKFLQENKEGTEALKISLGALAAFFIGPFKGALILAQSNLKAAADALEFLRLKAATPIVVGTQLRGSNPSGLDLLNEIAPLVKNQEALKGRPDVSGTGLLKDKGKSLTNADDAVVRRAIEKINALADANAKTLAQLDADLAREIASANQKLSAFQVAQNEAIRQGFFGDKSELDRANEFILFLKQAGGAITENEEREIRFNAALIESLNHAKELKASMADIAATASGPSGSIDTGGAILSDDAIDQLGDLPGKVDVFTRALGEARDQMGSFADFTDSILVGSFTALSDALAQGITAWALYGESFGKAMRQALAAIAAKIAAEAIFQAALHGAYAIASLAFGDFASAGQHAVAAAKFAGVAVLAGVAARGLAGGASAGGTSTGGGAVANTQRRQTTSNTPAPVVLNRNQAQPNVTLVLQGDASQFDWKVTRAVTQNINQNGEIRAAIKKEAA